MGRVYKRDERGVPKWKGVVELFMQRNGNVGIRYVKLPCGKKTCRTCPHGPYFYMVVWNKGKAKQTYLGKKIFSDRTKGRADLEVLLMNVIKGTGMRLETSWFDYQPEGFNARKMVVEA